MRRAVFLDRDGVVNRAVLRDGLPHPPATLADVRLLPGVRQACHDLHDAGFLLIVVTNQPDIARGAAAAEQIEEIHRLLKRYLPIEDIKMCPHDDAAQCACRKPKPGLLHDAARERGINLAASYLVGDRWRDIEAGHRAGCRAIFVDNGYRERRPDAPYLRVRSLREAAAWIVKTTRKELMGHARQAC